MVNKYVLNGIEFVVDKDYPEVFYSKEADLTLYEEELKSLRAIPVENEPDDDFEEIEEMKKTAGGTHVIIIEDKINALIRNQKRLIERER